MKRRTAKERTEEFRPQRVLDSYEAATAEEKTRSAALYGASRAARAGGNDLSHLFYQGEIVEFFQQYLDGEITIEQLVEYKNDPVRALQKTRQGDPFKVVFENVGEALRRIAVRRVAFSQLGQDAGKRLEDYGPVGIIKRRMREIKNESIVREGVKVQVATGQASKAKEKIGKLKGFLLQKMLDKNRVYATDTDVDNFKLCEMVLTVANETLERIDNQNMVDRFDSQQFQLDSQLSPKFFSDFNIRRKEKPRDLRELRTFSERREEFVRLRKLVKELDTRSSTNAELISDLFTQTADKYSKHLRPPTPPKIRKANNEMKRGLLSKSVQPSNKASYPADQPPAPYHLSTNYSSKTMKDSQGRSLWPAARKPFKIKDAMDKKLLQSERLERGTFSSTKKATKDTRDIEEYRFNKERRLLEYLKLYGKAHKNNRIDLDLKINKIVSLNKQIEEDRVNLQGSLREFNPLELQELKKYMDLTKEHTVDS